MDSKLGAAVRLAVVPSRRNRLLWACSMVAFGFQAMSVLVLEDGHIFEWEVHTTRILQRIPARYEVFDLAFWLTNTIAWEFIPIFGAAFGVAWLLNQRDAALLLLLSFPLHVFAQWPKAVIDRPRPPAGHHAIEGVGGFQSFPSGHAEFVITFWGFLAYLVVTHSRSTRVRLAVTMAWTVLAIATGVGRIAIGRHWPMDVLVSYVVGFGLLSGLIWLYSAIRAAGHRDRAERAIVPPADAVD
ncbi:phosphatase PAP2 family protein [Candidatus Amarobacter glycogenicus]|uniref:phosphatase PAP2 family protein n=1 Tax=Candidatus Amarobacter glycogenicus TaxID=3140699 RepID=UPI0031369A08|nr:phosphatase PAP2 family protein [Dehalococcoidia bacterium]